MEKEKSIKKEDLYMTKFYNEWYDVQKCMSNLQKLFVVKIEERNFGKKQARIHKQK